MATRLFSYAFDGSGGIGGNWLSRNEDNTAISASLHRSTDALTGHAVNNSAATAAAFHVVNFHGATLASRRQLNLSAGPGYRDDSVEIRHVFHAIHLNRDDQFPPPGMLNFSPSSR